MVRYLQSTGGWVCFGGKRCSGGTRTEDVLYLPLFKNIHAIQNSLNSDAVHCIASLFTMHNLCLLVMFACTMHFFPCFQV